MGLTDIPQWVTWIGGGFGAMVAAIIIRLGRRSGATDKVNNIDKTVHLEGAMVDSKSIERLTASIEGLILDDTA